LFAKLLASAYLKPYFCQGTTKIPSEERGSEPKKHRRFMSNRHRMTERRKSPTNSSPWFVDALFQLPLAARQILVTKYDLPVASEDLVLPTDKKQICEKEVCQKKVCQKELDQKETVVHLANTIAIEGDASSPLDENLANPTEVTTTILSPADDLEADALRALMGYGRLARRKDGSHDC
jgi:hypothetical protein